LHAAHALPIIACIRATHVQWVVSIRRIAGTRRFSTASRQVSSRLPCWMKGENRHDVDSIPLRRVHVSTRFIQVNNP
jgi:hypothetical protein